MPPGKVFVFNHFSARVGWIKDVSMGGVSFECTKDPGAKVDPEVIDIFSYDYDRFFLPAIPCKKVYEKRLSNTGASGGAKKTMRLGLQFDRLDENSSTKIENLIGNFFGNEAM
jgi:hypothetical protein